MKNLVISIECGEKTCAKEKGKFCCNVRTFRIGSFKYCGIWPGSDLEEKDGWLQRCPECLKAEKEFKGIIENVEQSGFDVGHRLGQEAVLAFEDYIYNQFTLNEEDN
jgi:hypothetical protein